MTLACILEAEDLAAVRNTVLTIAIGGSGFYFVKGVLRSSSEGRRLAGGVQAVVGNGPRVCRWAAWSGVLITIDTAVVRTRQFECLPSLAVAWAAANALFSVHRGTRAAVREGVKGAAYGGLASIAIYRMLRFLDSLEK